MAFRMCQYGTYAIAMVALAKLMIVKTAIVIATLMLVVAVMIIEKIRIVAMEK